MTCSLLTCELSLQTHLLLFIIEMKVYTRKGPVICDISKGHFLEKGQSSSQAHMFTFFVFLLETGSHYVALVGLELIL